jgi:hypothetical protein
MIQFRRTFEYNSPLSWGYCRDDASGAESVE